MLGIVTAFKEEVREYLRHGGFRVSDRSGYLSYYRSKKEPDVVLVEGGIGRKRASEATRQIAERYDLELIVSAGFAGGVQEGLRTGDVFLCERVMSIEGPAAFWSPDSANERVLVGDNLMNGMPADMDGPYEGDASCGCLSVPQFVPTSSMKSWIGSTFPVSIIDMESYWVSETAASYSIPHMVVRSVLDPVGQTLPAFIEESVSEDSGSNWARAVKYAVAKPMETPKLIQLAGQAKAARASLAEFLITLT